MKRIAIVVLALALFGYLAVLLIPMDPQEQRPGTGLSGTVTSDEPAPWQGRKQIFVETSTWYGIPHSVTTIAWLRDGTLYVPCGACASKRWPKNVAANADVRLKIDGQLYERRAMQVTDPHELHRVLARPDGDHPPDGVALYRMEPR